MGRRTRPRNGRKTIRTRRLAGQPHGSLERVIAELGRQQAAEDQGAEAAELVANESAGRKN